MDDFLSRREVLALASASALSLLVPGCGSLPTVKLAAGKATLPFSQFGALGSPGGAVAVQSDTGVAFVVIRSDAQSAQALDLTCTHAGCTLNLDAAAKNLPCPCHSSVFDYTGAPLRGPARTNLREYAAALQTDSIVVTIG